MHKKQFHKAFSISENVCEKGEPMIKDFAKLTGFSSKPRTIYVCETGDDKNDGKTIKTPVKTVERAYDIALCGKKHANIFVSGNITEGNIDPEKYKDIAVSFIAYTGKYRNSGKSYAPYETEATLLEELTVVCDTSVSGFSVKNAKLVSGSFTVLTGSVQQLSVCAESVFINMYGGDIGKLQILPGCKNLSVFNYCGDIRSAELSENAEIQNLQIVKPFSERPVYAVEKLPVCGKKIVVNLPQMKAPDGTEFGVYPTSEIGVFDTYSGAAYQFGWGKTTYTCYALYKDVAYYSNSATDFVLKIEESGVYNLELCGEHDWIVRIEAMVRGFSPEEHLTLPLDASGWEDNGCGKVTAKKYENYSFDGKVYTAKKAHKADFCAVKLPEYKNRYFVGWAKDESANEFYDTAFPELSSGDVAYAVFTDEKELAVCGASVDFKDGMTLKFFSSADLDLLKIFDDATLGTILIPSLTLRAMEEPGAAPCCFPDLKRDGDVLTFDLDKEYIDVPAEDNDVINGKVVYSVELSELSLAEAYADYTARAYVKFTDKNGVSRVIYGDAYENSAYYAAGQILKEKETFALSDDEIKYLEDGMKAIADFATAPANGRTTPYRGRGELPYDDLAIDIPYEEITEHQFAQGKNFYISNAGPVVREIHIEHTNPNVKSSVFGVIADAHINRVDRNGKDKYDAEVMFSYWTRPGFSQKWVTEAFLNATKLISTYDTFILNGDTVDYVTYGTLDYIKEKVLDKYDNCIFSMGNHEPVKNMQTYIPDIDCDRNHRQLYEYFDKELLNCHTTLLNDSILLMTFNNGSYYRYNQEQYDKLKEAIALAREKGYIILMFQHIMISTGNPEDTHVKSLSQGFGDSCTHPDGRNYYNFSSTPVTGSKYDFQINMHTPNDDLNDEMYDLITQNTDVIRGLFVGHNHRCDYMEILPRNCNREIIKDGSKPTIPVHNIDSNPYDGELGNVMKVVVTAKK